MSLTGKKMSHALVVLPLTLAVLLVSMCIPVACSAAPQTASAMPVTAPDCGHPTPRGLVPVTHTADVGRHMSWPVHQHGDPGQCKHASANQAVNTDQAPLGADFVALPAVAVPVAPPRAPLSLVLNERPSRPPGIVLTASQLRI